MALEASLTKCTWWGNLSLNKKISVIRLVVARLQPVELSSRTSQMRSQCSACRTPPVGKAEALKLSQRAHTWLLAQTNTVLNLTCTLLKRSVGQALLSQPCQRLAVARLQPRRGAARCIFHCPALVQAGVSTEGRSTWVEIVEEELKDSSLEMFPFRKHSTFRLELVQKKTVTWGKPPVKDQHGWEPQQNRKDCLCLALHNYDAIE